MKRLVLFPSSAGIQSDKNVKWVLTGGQGSRSFPAPKTGGYDVLFRKATQAVVFWSENINLGCTSPELSSSLKEI